MKTFTSNELANFLRTLRDEMGWKLDITVNETQGAMLLLGRLIVELEGQNTSFPVDLIEKFLDDMIEQLIENEQKTAHQRGELYVMQLLRDDLDHILVAITEDRPAVLN